MAENAATQKSGQVQDHQDAMTAGAKNECIRVDRNSTRKPRILVFRLFLVRLRLVGGYDEGPMDSILVSIVLYRSFGTGRGIVTTVLNWRMIACRHWKEHDAWFEDWITRTKKCRPEGERSKYIKRDEEHGCQAQENDFKTHFR